MLLLAMHRVVRAVRPGLVGPEAALYGYWMEWRTSTQWGPPLSMTDGLRLTSEGSGTSLQGRAAALLPALRTRLSMDAAQNLNHVQATYPRGMSELDAALHLLHPPDEDLEVGDVRIFVEGAGRTPSRPRPTNPVYDGTGPTFPYAFVCDAFPGEPAWCPALPPATRAPRSWAHPHLSPPLSRTRGAHHRGQVLWQERPGTPLLILVVATRGTQSGSSRQPPLTSTGERPCRAPPSQRPRRGTGCTPSCGHRRSLPLQGSTLCGSSRQSPTTSEGPEP